MQMSKSYDAHWQHVIQYFLNVNTTVISLISQLDTFIGGKLEWAVTYM